jgi:hypothetical protein
MNTQHFLQHGGYSNSSIEELLSEASVELNEYCSIQAKQDAEKETELTELSVKIKIWDYANSRMQITIDQIRQKLLPVSKIISVREFGEHAEKECTKKQAEIDYNEQLLAQQLRKKKTLIPDPLKLKWGIWVMVFNILAGASDGILVFTSFRAVYPFLLAVISAATVAAAISAAPLAYVPWILKAPTELKRRIRMAIIILVATAFFAVISNLRASSLSSTVSTAVDSTTVVTSSHIPATTICIVSVTLFCCVLFLSLRFWKSKEERLKEFDYRTLCNEISNTQNIIQQLQEDKQQLILKVQLEKKQARELYDYTKKSIICAKNIGEASMSVYKQTYARFHQSVPAFFQNKTDLIYDESLQFFEPQNESVS